MGYVIVGSLLSAFVITGCYLLKEVYKILDLMSKILYDMEVDRDG